MAFEVGTRIGKYELRRQIGKGGFGDVYVGYDAGLDRDVALKLLQPEHSSNLQVLQRFLQEARAAAKVSHPGIVTVFECGHLAAADGQHAFIAMELLAGESLTERMARVVRFAPAAAAEIARQIASTLEAAHRAGIIHRDLKPDNVFVVPDPATAVGERVKVLDFGIAKLADGRQHGVHTHAMMVFGTPRYMSPEQCRSATDIDARSDVYALGCILFEMLAGRPPFVGEGGDLLARHQVTPAPDLRAHAPDAPDALVALVARMLAKSPGDRPQTMGDVERQLADAGVLPTGSPTGLLHAAAASRGTAPTLPPSDGVAPTLLDDGASPAVTAAAPALTTPDPPRAVAPPQDGAALAIPPGGASGELDAMARRGGRLGWLAAAGLILLALAALAILALR